ncbi:unnamed protein product [Pocillopora meandrina]|uniref:Uncharacterized protein n=1 Tax=Pocillopora meandrina TaxID=46732 RepID=A0AAU9X084_9CNID|nr:unnamed protein product [Pocillopora meandrina]
MHKSLPKNPQKVPEEEIRQIEEFYLRDNISRILPGKKDKVSVNAESGREAIQERLLLVNLREAHALFKEGLKLKVGFSKFVSLRPPQVLPMTLCDQEVRMCKYH